MKITIDPKSFADAITWVTKNYDTKSSTSNVVLHINKKNEGTLSYSSSISFMKDSFQVLELEADAEEIGKDGVFIALDGRYLQKLAGPLASTKNAAVINYSDSDNSTFVLKTSQGQFTVPILNVSIAREPKMVPLGEVDEREFFDNLQRLGKVCDANNGVPVLSAVDINLDLEEKKIVMMATDRYVLAESIVDFDPAEAASTYVEENSHILLPMEDALLIAPAKGLSVSVTLIYTEKGNKFGYVFSDGRVALFALKDADPMRYAPMKKNAVDNVTNSSVLNLAELKKAISTISSLAWEEVDIQFIISENEFIVSDAQQQNQIAVEFENPDIHDSYAIHFMRVVLSKAFNPIATTKVKVSWKDEVAALTLTPVLDDGEVSDNVLSIFIPLKSGK